MIPSVRLFWLGIPIQSWAGLGRQSTIVVRETWLLDLINLQLLSCFVNEESLLTFSVALLRCFVNHRHPLVHWHINCGLWTDDDSQVVQVVLM